MTNESRARELALRGLTRCNSPARWEAKNGYRACDEHVFCLGNEEAALLSESGPGPWGKCDYCTDGMGASSWPKRLAAAKCTLGIR